MELWQLRTFRVVAETLNFTKAGERLNLTQSAVSHQIKALENDLGEPLFLRSKRGVKLSQKERSLSNMPNGSLTKLQPCVKACLVTTVRP